tara:strand:+ start:397 stop:648 length:252 start_codon:yes stop_codon:yes gene_type:complete
MLWQLLENPLLMIVVCKTADLFDSHIFLSSLQCLIFIACGKFRANQFCQFIKWRGPIDLFMGIEKFFNYASLPEIQNIAAPIS